MATLGTRNWVGLPLSHSGLLQMAQLLLCLVTPLRYLGRFFCLFPPLQDQVQLALRSTYGIHTNDPIPIRPQLHLPQLLPRPYRLF